MPTQFLEVWLVSTMLWLLASFVFSLLLLLVFNLDLIGWVRRYYYICRLLKPIPGRPTHWLFGNLLQMDTTEESLLRWQSEVVKNRWRVTRAWIGPFLPGVGIHHPESIRKILKEPKKRSTYALLEPWLGEGLLIANGTKWFRNRRLLTPAFHFEILKPYIQVYNDCTSILLSKWKAKASQGEPVEVYKSIDLLSLDIILRCAFSYQSDCQRKSDSNLYIKAVSDLCKHISQRFIIDWYFLYFTRAGWNYRKALDIVHKEAEKLIKKRRVALGLLGDEPASVKLEDVLKKSGTGRSYLDFLDVLLTAQDENGHGLTDLEIRNEVDTFLFEGHDTTANGITWALYLLAKHPEHQDKCREEIRSVLQGREQLECDDLVHLEYTTWCIKEALRLYPPVFIAFRETTEETQFESFTIPKGIRIGLNIYGIHHNPEVWSNPEEFDPLRLHPTNTADMHPFAYIPFSAGPRNCIGQNFALNEAKVVVSSILNRFSLSLVDGHKVSVFMSILLKTSDDIKLSLKPLEC